MALPHGAVGWSAVCDCGIFRSYLLTFSIKHVTKCWYERDDDWSWYFKLLGTTQDFSCINICRVPRMLFEHEADRPSVQTFCEGPGKC